MQFIITAKHFELSETLKEYAESKIGRIRNHFDHLIEVDVVLSVQHNRSKDKRQVVEATIWAEGIVFRACEASADMYASIDLVSEKLERQVTKYKNKLNDRTKRRANLPTVGAKHSIMTRDREGPKIVRTRGFSMKPMFIDDAVLELELSKQEFLVFSNAETKNVNVIYKRSDGSFGLIEPDY